MTCSIIVVDGHTAIVKHSGPPILQCHVAGCEGFQAYACDWKVPGGTCDAPMCETHRHNVGKNRDLCFAHNNAWQQHPANKQRTLDL